MIEFIVVFIFVVFPQLCLFGAAGFFEPKMKKPHIKRHYWYEVEREDGKIEIHSDYH